MSSCSDKDQITAYPLQWPLSQPRTETGQRQYARFGTRSGDGYGTRQLTLAQACQRLYTEVAAWTRAGRTWRIDPDDLIISTNVALRLDGKPRSGQRAPEDPGAAAYFVLDGDNYCLPCDRWLRVRTTSQQLLATWAQGVPWIGGVWATCKPTLQGLSLSLIHI